MQKIPTMFIRTDDRKRVTKAVTISCFWAAKGEGAATQKLDGTCCLVKGGKLFKRREVAPGATPPDEFDEVALDAVTGKRIGWMPVDCSKWDDRWHCDAFGGGGLDDGTYELVGPKVQGNPEKRKAHELARHGSIVIPDVPRDFDGLREWLRTHDVEGIVFHHPDGRMAKIKKRDFGLKR